MVRQAKESDIGIILYADRLKCGNYGLSAVSTSTQLAERPPRQTGKSVHYAVSHTDYTGA